MKLFYLNVAFLLWACGASSPASNPQTTPATATPTTAVSTTISDDCDSNLPSLGILKGEELLETASSLRELRFIQSVPVRTRSAESISLHLQEELKSEELEKTATMYQAIGLLEKSTDVQRTLLEVLKEQVVGYYDPKRKELVLRCDVAEALSKPRYEVNAMARLESEGALIHELVHALQDQHFGLSELTEKKRTMDAQNAFQSIVEGDATLAMLALMAQASGRDLKTLTDQREVLRQAASQAMELRGGKLREAPSIVRTPLISAYLNGMLFCADLYRKNSWRGINQLYADLPTTTEQILHPEQYAKQAPSENLSLPQVPIPAASVVHEDTLGELELRIFFEQGLGTEEAVRAAEGWGGDRLRVYSQSNGVLAFLWRTQWDTPNQAQEAEAAAKQIRTKGTLGSSFQIHRSGRNLWMSRGIDAALFKRIAH